MAHIGYAVTNGGTLEDCHTNVFLLTELNGLKWCKFSLPPNFNANFSDTCDDPILNAYSQCLKHGVLSVWRRIPQAPATVSSQSVNNAADQLNNFSSNTQNKTDFRLNAEKELQVFWYGEEPDWTLLAAFNLTKSCKGSWEDGIDYETRTLLFKSLHNLIEKCLLGNRYVRLGRWFLKPLPSYSASNDKKLLAFSLTFFIHGENDVCVCVNVQKQPAVYQLGNDIQVDKQSLLSQQPSNSSTSRSGAKQSVILSPWSIKGSANLDEFKYVDSEQVKARKMEILREWAKFYPLSATEGRNIKNEDSEMQSNSAEQNIPFAPNLQMLPNGNLPVIEVNVGGVKIMYPSFYVLMASQDEKTDSTDQNSAAHQQRNFGLFSSSNCNNSDCRGISAVRKMKPSTSGRLQRRILERIEEELTLNKTGCISTSDLANELSSNLWNLTELSNNPLLIPSLPAEKESCRCPLYPPSSTMLLPGLSASGNGGGQSSPQVPNKAQLKFGLAASGHAISNVGKIKQDRRDKLQKCGAFHKRQPMLATSAATPITASLESKNSLASMAQYVAPIAVTVAPSASIQMISPVASSTNVASIMQPFNNDSSAASINTPLYTNQQTSSYHFPENPGSDLSLSENLASKMIPSPSTLISTKSFMKLAASDRERFSLLEQPCSSSSSSMIILKRWLADNRLNRVILPYRRTKNWANKNSTCVDQKLSFFLSDQYDRNRSKDEPLESLSLYDNSNNYRDENLNVNAANCQLATAYQTNNLGDFRPENSFPRHNWVQSSMSGVVHPHMCDHGRTDFNPRNPSCVPTQHRAFPRKSAVPPFHLQACDTKVNLWTASSTQHPKPGQNARIVGEVNYGAVTSSQLEPINDSRLFQTCDTFGANTTMLTMEHQQWNTPSQGPMQFRPVQQSVQNEPNMHTMSLHLQQHAAINYQSVDQQYNYQQLPQQQPVGQFASTMTNVSHHMTMPENIMADSGGSDSEEDHTTFLSPPPSHGQEEDMMPGRKTKTVNSTPNCNPNTPLLQQQISEAAKRPAVASLLDYGIYPTPPSVDGATQFSPESCSTTSGRLEAHTINAYYGTSATSQNTRPTSTRIEANEGLVDKITCDGLHFTNEQNSSKYKLSNELSTILLEFAQSNKFSHVIEVAKSRSSLSRFLSCHSAKRKFETANNKKSLFLEYKPNNIILFNHHHATNNNLFNSPISQILQTTTGRNQTFSSPIFSPPSKFAGFPFSPSSSSRHPSGGGGPSSVNPLSALASLPQPLPSFSSPAQSLQQLQRQQPPPPQFVDRSPLPQNSPYSIAKTPKTPLGLDLQSPLSNASSHYTNRNHGSIGGISSSVYTNYSPEANGLYLSLLLCDTFLNLHKDCVFDSCPLCVCCMNIQGSFAEVSLYLLSQPLASGSNDQNYQQNTSKCSCGFSAPRNRYLTYKSGQFYEDECEVTGLWPGAKRNNFGDEPLNLLGQDRAPFDIVELIRSYSLMPDFHLMLPVANWRLFTQEQRKNSSITRREDKISEKTQDFQIQSYHYSELELNDFAEYCNMALEQASMVGDCTTPSRDDLSKSKTALVHSWAFLKARKPISSVDAVSLIRNLLPMLQESVQKPRSVYQSKHSVEGPLTWRQFHRKCSHRISNSGREDLSGPEPVPTLLVSVEKEWVSLSPFSLRFWDRLSLEPFGQTKDVAYVVVLPDNPSLAHKARNFFRELSKTYESMRLGRHCPLSKVLKDGLMRVSKTRVSQVTNLSVDPWFERLEQACQASNRAASCSASDKVGCYESSSSSTAVASLTSNVRQILAQKYKVYAQVCRHSLAPHLAEHIFDRTIFRDQSRESAGVNIPSINSSSGDSAMPPPATPSPSGPFYDSGQESMYSDVSGCEVSLDPNSLDYAPPVPHVTVVYLINAFTYGLETSENEDDDRLTSTALFRCYLEVLNGMPLAARAHVQLQIVPLQAVLDFSCPEDLISTDDMTPVTRSIHRQPFPSQSEYYRQLSLNVFSHSRSVGSQFLLAFQAKPLTAIGPAAGRIDIIKRKMEASAVDPNRSIYRMYCPAVVLASSIGEQQQAAAAATVPLLASSSSNFGAVTAGDESARVLFVTYCPSDNLNSSSQSQRCWLLAAATDHQGILLENCVIDTNINNRWCAARRSVIFEALKKLWDFICGLLANGCQPWRLVIGRLGRIGHDELKVWAHLLNKNQLRATSRLLRDHCGICPAMPGFQETPCILSACLISTEADAHLRVFPDSFAYDERFGQSAKQCPLSTPEDVSCTHLMVFPTSAFQMSQNGVVSNSGIGPMDDIDEFNMNWDIPDGIDGIDDGNLNELLGETGFDGGNLQNRMPEATDDSIQLQPLALGYIVSTAPIEHAPDFFWSYCPSARYTNPVHLRSALHINTSAVQQNDDQFLTNAGKNASNMNNHALDSSLTTDVLRYALETYNALSWLSLSPSTGDRRSCLPIHMQALCRLHRTLNRLL